MTARLVARLAGHETISFFRTPTAAIFTVAMPLMMMVIIGAAVGNDVVDPRSGVRVMQFVVPVMTVFGIAQGCFGALAIHLADVRDRGYLKRLRGTPVPAWAVLAGLAGAALVIALVTTVMLFGAGLIFYDVQMVWRTLPSLLLTLLVGAACFTALGFAVTALVRNAATVQLLGTGLLLALGFISDIMLVGAQMPAWLDTLGWIFPLRHFAGAVRDDLNPLLTGAGFHGDHLAVMAVWGIGAVAVAVWRFNWERPQSSAKTVKAAKAARTGVGHGRPAPLPGRPSVWRLIAGQAAHSALRMRRDSSTVFFTVALPVLLLTLISLVFGQARVDGVTLPRFMLAAMIAYTVGVSSYVNLAEVFATDRDRGVRKRLAATPLPSWAYHAGGVACALAVTLATGTVLTLVARFGYGVGVRIAMIPGLLVAVLLGVACFAVLGALVATLVSKATTVAAITLGTFLPLAFVSDVFIIGGPLPGVLEAVGDVFPLKHLSHALLAALDPAGHPWQWGDLAVVAGWTLAGALALAVAPAFKHRLAIDGA